jgi:pimeloyl-ACP methyl ester carboxylesterase
MVQLLRYLGLDKRASAEDIDKLVESWSEAAKPGLNAEKRSAAFRDLFLRFYKLHGIDYSDNPQVVSGLVQFAVSGFRGGARLDLKLPEPRGPISGDYIHVEKTGRGPVNMLLISDGGVDGRELYKSFVERNKDLFTMHIVTLPGAGLAKTQPWPEVFDLARRPWLSNIEQSISALLDKIEMDTHAKIIVIGTAIGGYFAALLALSKPNKIRASVLVDALVCNPMRSRVNPDRPAAIEERLSLMKRYMPPQFLPLAVVPRDRLEVRKLIDDPANPNPAVKNWMAFSVKNDSLSKQWSIDALSNGFFTVGGRMGSELMTTDLTEGLKNLSVPTLVMSALQDDSSPSFAFNGITQWQEIKTLYPNIPLTVATFEDTRTYISEDSPAEFDRSLNEFLAGSPVEGKHSPRVQARPSPNASVSQVVGSTQVTINYCRPALSGRKLRELLPAGRVWRTGANEATTIVFGTDVLIQGQRLASGTYTLFTIPDEKEWTVIFNKVTTEWGAFNYNPAFDALRVKAVPQPAELQERFGITFELTGPKTAEVVLRWDRSRVAFKVENAD